MSHKAFKCVRKKRKVFRKYKDINHPAIRSACKTARSELHKSRLILKINLDPISRKIENPSLHTFEGVLRAKCTLDQFTVIPVIIQLLNYYLDRDQLGGQRCATLITLSRCSGNATLLNPTLRILQLIENHGDLRVLLD